MLFNLEDFITTEQIETPQKKEEDLYIFLDTSTTSLDREEEQEEETVALFTSKDAQELCSLLSSRKLPGLPGMNK